MKFLMIFSFLGLLSVSCKVSLSGAQTGEATSMSVSLFMNNASVVNPSLSQSITEDIRNYFQTQSPLIIVSSNADMRISGEIMDYRVTPVAIGNTAAASNRLTISIKVSFSNTKDSSKDFESTFSRFADFSASQNLEIVEKDLISQINQQLAQDIFNKALINW